MKEKKESSAYTNCMNLWFEFYKFHNGVAPKIDGTTGKHLKPIVKYFEDNVKTHSPESCFSAMLNNWHLLPDYYQRQKEMRQINSNLNIILTEIKSKYVRPERKLPSHWEI